MRARQEEIARSITLENGKSLTEARLEVIRGCEFFEWDAGECIRLYGRVIPSAPGIRYIVLHEPIGPVAAFSPWNFPMSQPARKIGGAIASGCSVIIKASEETPRASCTLRAPLRKPVCQPVCSTSFSVFRHRFRNISFHSRRSAWLPSPARRRLAST